MVWRCCWRCCRFWRKLDWFPCRNWWRCWWSFWMGLWISRRFWWRFWRICYRRCWISCKCWWRRCRSCCWRLWISCRSYCWCSWVHWRPRRMHWGYFSQWNRRTKFSSVVLCITWSFEKLGFNLYLEHWKYYTVALRWLCVSLRTRKRYNSACTRTWLRCSVEWLRNRKEQIDRLI